MSQSHRFGNVEVRPAERALLIDGKPADLGGYFVEQVNPPRF